MNTAVRPSLTELAALAGGAADEAGWLARQQVALLQAEVGQELAKVGRGAAAVAAGGGLAAAGGLMGGLLLAHAARRLLGLPTWAGYAAGAGLLGLSGTALLRYGRAELADVRPLPETTEALAENLAWLRTKLTAG